MGTMPQQGGGLWFRCTYDRVEKNSMATWQTPTINSRLNYPYGPLSVNVIQMTTEMGLEVDEQEPEGKEMIWIQLQRAATGVERSGLPAINPDGRIERHD